MKVEDDDDIHIANIMSMIIKSVFKSQDKDTQDKAREVVDVDE